MSEIKKLIEKQKKKSRRKKVIAGVKSTISLVSSVTHNLLQLRDKPKPLDYFGIGISFLNTGIQIREEIAKLNVADPRSFYDSSIHYVIPYTLEKTVFSLLKDQETIIKNNKISLNKGLLLTFEIYWIKDGTTNDRPFCNLQDKNNIITAIGDILWLQNGSKNIMLDSAGELISSNESLGFKAYETRSLLDLDDRIGKFYKQNETRSYLLEGPPGTGKSSAAVYIIEKMGVKSLRTTLSSLYGNHWKEQSNSISNLDTLLEALHPEIIIIDDIDRGHMSDQQMLKLFETMRRYCKIIIATCNNKNSMIGAMLRVGRFDDHIEINHLDIDIVKKMLDKEDQDLAERFCHWPIAYIDNYKKVKMVMGKESARLEVDDMEARIFEIKRKTESESRWKIGPKKEEKAPKKKAKRKPKKAAKKAKK